MARGRTLPLITKGRVGIHPFIHSVFQELSASLAFLLRPITQIAHRLLQSVVILRSWSRYRTLLSVYQMNETKHKRAPFVLYRSSKTLSIVLPFRLYYSSSLHDRLSPFRARPCNTLMDPEFLSRNPSTIRRAISLSSEFLPVVQHALFIYCLSFLAVVLIVHASL